MLDCCFLRFSITWKTFNTQILRPYSQITGILVGAGVAVMVVLVGCQRIYISNKKPRDAIVASLRTIIRVVLF